MAEHAGKPKVRFAGFTEDWEQRKLGEVAKLNNGKDYKHLGDGNIPVYGTGGYMLSVNQALSYKDDAIGIGRKGTIDKPYILKAPFWTVDTLFYSIPNDKTELNFLFATFQKVDWKAADESTGVPSLSKSTIENIITFFPSLPEQARIGAFFCHLDRLITLHQRKRGRLENIKKAMLEKMFPKNGADVPEVRFAGFTEAWEQRKLGEIAEKTFGGGTPSTSNPDFWSGKIPWIQSSDLTEDNLFDVKPRKFISKLAIKSSASKIIPKNSIAIIVRVGVGKLAFLPFNYSTSQDFLSITEINVDELFASYSIYKKLKKDLSLVQGTSIKGITKEELLGKTLFIPIKKSEQARIGAFFRHLDRLVTLHQRKVALLQNIKKACLEKMFV